MINGWSRESLSEKRHPNAEKERVEAILVNDKQDSNVISKFSHLCLKLFFVCIWVINKCLWVILPNPSENLCKHCCL